VSHHIPPLVPYAHGEHGVVHRELMTGPPFELLIVTEICGRPDLATRGVADMVKRRSAAAGADGLFSEHTMHSGFATEAYAKGTAELAIMRHGRWNSNAVIRAMSRKAASGTTTPLPASAYRASAR
jgi:hypothetical protein